MVPHRRLLSPLTKTKIGCILPLETGNFDRVVEAAQQCEKLGYDSVWAFDHLAPYWTKPKTSLECWTVLSALAERTSRVKIGSMVTNVSLRHPITLARITSSLDVISKGRLILGLGTGDRLSRPELTSYGYSFDNLETRVGRLDETIKILKAAWTGKEFAFKGRHYQISHLANNLKPIQKPNPPIWLGGKHRKIINIIAESGDGWNYWNLKESESERLVRYLQKRCLSLQRPFDRIVKSWSGSMHQRTLNKEKILTTLRSEVNNETRYLVASFGPRVNSTNYEIFAEAAAQL